jgi:hypothetical protein
VIRSGVGFVDDSLSFRISFSMIGARVVLHVGRLVGSLLSVLCPYACIFVQGLGSMGLYLSRLRTLVCSPPFAHSDIIAQH